MTVKISKRAAGLIESPIRKFLPLVQEAEKQGVKFYKMNVGDPDIRPPKSIFDGIRGFREANIGYAPSPGISRHVAAWVKYYRQFKIRLRPQNIIPTVGGAEAIFMAMMAVADSGEELIVFEPLYASYKGFAKMAGIKLVPVTLNLAHNFKLPNAREIIKKITKKTRAIVIINPDNPTGKAWSRQELATIIKIAKQHNLIIISDETYREIVFKGRPISILNFHEARERAIVIDSLSKRFSAPGIRIGAIVSFNENIMKVMLKIAMVRLSAGTVEQIATVDILEKSQAYSGKLKNEYKKRSETVQAELKKIAGVKFNKPQGAFYQVIELPVRDSEDFIKFLITSFRDRGETVLLAPMADFYVTAGLGKNQARLAYVLNSRDLKRGMEIVRLGLREYLKTLNSKR